MNRFIYIWLDNKANFRSKVRYSTQPDWWQYDGSSTGQAKGSLNTEVYLKPVKQYTMPPFVHSTQKDEAMAQFIILCETYLADKVTPHPDNKRSHASQILDLVKVKSEEPWYGFELEFFMTNIETGLPLGFKTEIPPDQGPFYCGVGAGKCFGRQIMDEFEQLCILCKIGLVGSNVEVACGQWEYQIFGEGLAAADDAWVSRYLLDLVAEKYNVEITWHPKPFLNCNGSGMHVNFSTKTMRDQNLGRAAINEAIQKLSLKHKEHLAVYGELNHLRLTGLHETSSMDVFTHGVGTRNTSIRINHDTEKNGYGYIEDRRPASSCNMYSVAAIMASTTILSD
jgi:glutamine synthetase